MPKLKKTGTAKLRGVMKRAAAMVKKGMSRKAALTAAWKGKRGKTKAKRKKRK